MITLAPCMKKKYTIILKNYNLKNFESFYNTNRPFFKEVETFCGGSPRPRQAWA